MADQAGQRGAHRARYQHDCRLVSRFLLADTFGQALVQSLCESGFQRGAVALRGLLQDTFQLRVEGEHRQLRRHSGDLLHDETAQRGAHRSGQRGRVLAHGGVLDQRFGDLAQLADRNALDQQVLQHAHHRRQRQRLRRQIFDELGRALAQVGQQVLHFLVAQQFRRVFADQVRQVRGDHGGRVDHGVAHGLGLGALVRLDPGGIQAKCGVLAGDALQRAQRAARVQRQFAVGVDIGGSYRHAMHQHPVAVGRQFQVVADVHGRDQEAHVLGQLAAHALDARHQLAALVGIHQRDQPVTHFQSQRIDRAQFVPAQLGGWRGGRAAEGIQRAGFSGSRGRIGRRCLALAVQLPGNEAEDRGQRQESDVGHARHQADQAEDAGGDRQGAVLAKHLAGHGLGHVLRARGAGDQHRHGAGDQQRRQLRHQAVTDGQQGVGGGGIAERHAMLQHAHGQATEHVDEQDQDAGDGVAADELAGAVHRTVEVGFLANLFTTGLGFFTRQQTGVQVGVDGHLLAGHGVEDEARGHFRDAPGALGDDHEVDDGQDGEDHDAHGVVAADDEFTEGGDDLAGRLVAVLAVQQDDAGGGHVQRQPQHGGDQQHDREDREVQRPLHVDDRQQHHQRDGDVEGEQCIEHRRGQRHHDHGQQGQHDQRRAKALADHLQGAAGVEAGSLGVHARPPLPNSSTSTCGTDGIGPVRQLRSW